MTYKHINFHDSSVMRELERRSFKNIKLASLPEKKSVTITGNLFIDLTNLANRLREKGYNKEAANLESKIFLVKKSSQEYIQELSLAHPDGDASIVDAQDNLGDVETLESVHQKMLNTLKNKKLLSMAAGILGIKKADEEISENETAEDIFSGKNESKKIIIKEINDFISAEYPKIYGILKSKDIDLSKWFFNFDNLYDASKEHKELYAFYAGVNLEDINKLYKSYNTLYGRGFSGDEYSKVLSVINAYLKNEDINSAINYGNVTGANIGNKYFVGSQPNEGKKSYLVENPEKQNNIKYRDNPNSVWKFSSWSFSNDFTLDEEKLASATKEITKSYYDLYQSIFGEEKLAQTNAKFQEQLKIIMGDWENATLFFAKPQELSPEVKSVSPFNMEINSQAQKLFPYLEKGEMNKKIIGLATVMWPGWAPNLSKKAEEAIQEINKIVTFINSKPLHAGDTIVQNPSRVVSILMGAAKMYWEASKQVDNKSKTYSNYVNNQNASLNLAKAIKSGAGKPYSVIYQYVKENFPDATTYDKLLQQSQNWLNESSKITGYPADEFVSKEANRAKDKLTKNAQKFVRETDSAPQKNTSSISSGANNVNIGLAKANMNDPKEASVALMQQYLAYFAQALSNESVKTKFTDYKPEDIAQIIRTGPKANPAVNTYDGKWGNATQSALELANKYLAQLKISLLDTKARYVSKTNAEDTETAAKKNISILSQANQMLGTKGLDNSAGAINSSLYDKLPNKIDWENVKYPLMQHNVPVNSQDMSNLGSLYDMIVKNNWAEPQFMKDDDGFDIEGFSARNWSFFVQWFQKRAQFVYNVSIRSDKNMANIAKEYYYAAKKLEGQLNSYFNNYGFDSRNETDIVNIDDLRDYSNAKGSKNFDPRDPQNIKNKSKNMRNGLPEYMSPSSYRGRTMDPISSLRKNRQNNLEGQDFVNPQDNENPPIGPNGVIDLSSRWFNGLDQKLGIQHNPLLNPDLFKRYTVADLSKTFFSGSGDVQQQAQRQAIVATGLEIERYDEAAQDYIVRYFDSTTQRQQRTYAMRVPAYQKAYKARLTAGPVRSFGALLQTISGSLGKAIGDWIRYTDPTDQEKQAEEAWHLEWQRILNRLSNEAVGQ